MSSRVNSGGGSPRNGCSRSSGGHQGIPSCAYRASSSGAGGNSPRPATYAWRSGRDHQSSVPKRAGSATTSSTGTPSTVTPTARRSLRSSTEHDRGERLERVEHRSGPSRRGHDREVERDVGPAARIACNLAADSRPRSPRAVRAPDSMSSLSAAAASLRARVRRAGAVPSAVRSPRPTSAALPAPPPGTPRRVETPSAFRSRPSASARRRGSGRAR